MKPPVTPVALAAAMVCGGHAKLRPRLPLRFYTQAGVRNG
jgi:hypothetical protein